MTGMKTDALISALAADAATPLRPARRVLVMAFAAGTTVSGIAFLATLGVREDLGAALATWRFDLKLAVMALAMVTAFCETLRLMRPTGRTLPVGLTLFPVAILGAAVIAELALVPPDAWRENLVGTNAGLCLVAIPALSLAPLLAILAALRYGAPRCPVSAGASAGRLAAALAALLYGVHCVDDSPLFVATWYTLAVLPVTAIATLAGRRLLRW